VFSANDDPKMVRKGIRIKTNKRSNNDAPNSDSGNQIDSAVTGNSDQNERPSKKTKTRVV
jgi:hypothetical protein